MKNLRLFLTAGLLATLGGPAGAATSTFDVAVVTGSISIGTTTAPTSVLQVVGTALSTTTPRLRWIESKGALQSGGSSGTSWSTAGLYSAVFGLNNEASADYSFAGGGFDNRAIAVGATICGGGIASSTPFGNDATGTADALVGGIGNLVGSGWGFIGGGEMNSALATASVVCGGSANQATQTNAAIGGGAFNDATGTHSTVIGGRLNEASGAYSTVAGGFGNVASGAYAFAAGDGANAAAPGTFVWADSQGGVFTSNTTDQFRIRAAGGMDVEGSAQFGTGATKSTFTTTGQLKLAAAGIQWSDGSVALTAPAGNAVLSATQTFSGANTFLSSMTVGATEYVSAVILSSGVLLNSWMIVASQAPSASSMVTLTGLSPNKMYRLRWALTHSAASGLRLRFNSDTGNNYQYTVFQHTTSGASETVGSDSASYCATYDSQVDSGKGEFGHLEFRTQPGDGTILRGSGQNSYMVSLSRNWAAIMGCSYDGGSNLSSVSLYPDAGNVTGYIYLEQLMTPQL